jgi:hypothetical protein
VYVKGAAGFKLLPFKAWGARKGKERMFFS